MRKIVVIILALLQFLNMTSIFVEAETEIVKVYVSPDGSDEGNGSIENPFQTIERAKLWVREHPLRKKVPIEVILRGGHYNLEETIAFDGKDSGSRENPIVYMVYDDEKVYLDGGYFIPSNLSKPASSRAEASRLPEAARDKILSFDLVNLGIHKIDELEHSGNGLDHVAMPPMVLYYNGMQMSLARWPNGDGLVKTKNVIDPGSGRNDLPRRPGKFVYEEERVENWADITNVWMFGYWYYEWAPSNTAVASIDKEENIISTKHYSRYGYAAGKEYYYFNVIEELDTPGEYYIDRKNCVLYLYPPDDSVNAEIYLTSLKSDMFSFSKASYITLKNFTIEGTRASGISIDEGEQISVDACEIRYIGSKAVRINSGRLHQVVNCTMYELGAGGVLVSAGDFEFIRPAKCLIDNNHIYEFATDVKTYSAAVAIGGVGNTISHNLIHGADHLAITFTGIDNIFEYNEIYNVLRKSDDAGGIYSYLDAESRGGVVRYNYLHHMGKRGAMSASGNWAIYWDGFHSDKDVYGNIISDVEGGLMLNGGQYHTITSNLFYEVNRPLRIHPVTVVGSSDFWKTLLDLPYNRGIWKQKFPEASEKANAPSRLVYQENTVENNIYYKCGNDVIADVLDSSVKNYIKRPKVITDDSYFADVDNMDFTIISKDVPEGFYIPSIEEIGLRREGS